MKKVVSVLFILAIIVFSVLMVSYSSDQKPEKVLRHYIRDYKINSFLWFYTLIRIR